MRWLDKLLGRDDESTVAHERPHDPRGGIQSDEYRHADPRDLVEEGGTTMSGPAGAPQEELSPEERRELDRETD
jgi:hypothetical protein